MCRGCWTETNTLLDTSNIALISLQFFFFGWFEEPEALNWEGLNSKSHFVHTVCLLLFFSLLRVLLSQSVTKLRYQTRWCPIRPPKENIVYLRENWIIYADLTDTTLLHLGKSWYTNGLSRQIYRPFHLVPICVCLSGFSKNLKDTF